MNLKSVKFDRYGKQGQNIRVTISGSNDFAIAVEVCRGSAKARCVEIIDPKERKLVMKLTHDEAGKMLAALTLAMATDRPADACSALEGLGLPSEPKPKRSTLPYKS